MTVFKIYNYLSILFFVSSILLGASGSFANTSCIGILKSLDNVKGLEAKVVELQTINQQKEIAKVFLRTNGEELTFLKNRLNSRKLKRNLYKLIYKEITSDRLREEVLLHIRNEALGNLAEDFKVLFDIDDTVYQNWADDRYPSKTVYPGAIEFFKWIKNYENCGSYCYITARPEHFGIAESHTNEFLESIGFPDATGLLNTSLLAWIGGAFSNEMVLNQKVFLFERYERLFPEYNFIFVGDSGQADVDLGIEMLKRFPDRVKVLIHELKEMDPVKKRYYQEAGIAFFRNYVEASLLAYNLKLINLNQVNIVSRASLNQFNRLKFDDVVSDKRLRQELESALKKVSSLIK